MGCTRNCISATQLRPRPCTSSAPSSAIRLYFHRPEHRIRGKMPFTWRNKDRRPRLNWTRFQPAPKPIDYPKPDGVISFDRLSSVFLSSTNHEEDQPSHLRLQATTRCRWPTTCRNTMSRRSATVRRASTRSSRRTAKSRSSRSARSNCVHCKTCDIKDPKQNIIWTVPEGGGGPNYSGM